MTIHRLINIWAWSGVLTGLLGSVGNLITNNIPATLFALAFMGQSFAVVLYSEYSQ